MGTAVVESRIELRTLATLDRYLCASGQEARSKSDLMWRCMELLCGTLVKQGLTALVEDEEEAFLHLTERFGALGKAGRNGRMQMIDMQRETLAKDGFDPTYATVKATVTKGDAEAELKKRWRAACEAAKKFGVDPLSFDQWLENLESMRVQREEAEKNDRAQLDAMHDVFSNVELLNRNTE